MDASDFIVPPPGIVPDAPKPPAETVRARPVERTLPSFTPGATGLPLPPPPAFGVPSTPPAAAQGASAPGGEVTGERTRWRLADGAGVDAVLVGPSVVGRVPRTTDAPGAAHAVALDDPARTVSKTHALIVPDGPALVVTDLRSTNGVRVVRQGGAIERLEAGGTTRVGDGEVLVLGELRLLAARLPSPDV